MLKFCLFLSNCIINQLIIKLDYIQYCLCNLWYVWKNYQNICFYNDNIMIKNKKRWYAKKNAAAKFK